jgi:uncharacterized protein YkwD
MAGINSRLRGAALALSFVACSVLTSPLPTIATQVHVYMRANCAAPVLREPAAVLAGLSYLKLAYAAVNRDRAQYAGLGPLSHSDILQAIAERHSSYMASVGGWSDGDPAGWILDRVRATGLNATYAGQNVASMRGPTIDQALASDEALFAREAGTSGPHWANITNPNHHFMGMGAAMTGSAGDYTVYLTQVFSDVGSCGTSSGDTFTQASDIAPALRVGSLVYPSVDTLMLRREPGGIVLETLHANDRLKVIALLPDWAQVEVLRQQIYGWVSTQLVSASQGVRAG